MTGEGCRYAERGSVWTYRVHENRVNCNNRNGNKMWYYVGVSVLYASETWPPNRTDEN